MNDLPPMVPPRPEHERPVIDEERLIGSAHAYSLLDILRAHDRAKLVS